MPSLVPVRPANYNGNEKYLAIDVNMLSIILIGLLSVLFAVTGVLLTVAIVGDVFRSNRVRECLKGRIMLVRMNKMLARRNIPIDEYLHREPVSKIEQQIRACERCETPAPCDEVLSTRTDEDRDFGFCPNNDAFGTWQNRPWSSG